ncbi:thioredoxin [Paenibacillus humicola]|uniref:thioredoxin n=1 Tax=Paenibacillus humicola TaxID=3110540 RepID=UPI00237A9CB2|nr:thioredoxin [Paenibacillus humicola]
MAITHVTDQTFGTSVKGQEGTVLVDFWAPWCGPCKALAPILDELEAESESRYRVAKVNVDDNPQTAEQLGIMSIPTLVLFRDGAAVDKTVGFRSKAELKAWIDSRAEA